MAATKYYTWTWQWSDHEDEIIASRQLFSSSSVCELDGMRHFPYIRQADLKGRKGCPQLHITEQQADEFRWFIIILDADNQELGTYAQEKWYNTFPECIEASKNTEFHVSEPLKCEIDIERRPKQS